jgi:hypothetical protein
MHTTKKYLATFLFAIFLCNVFFVAIYSLSFFIPKNDVIKSLNFAKEKEVLKTPNNSIERSPTGANIDFGTECVALSIGLKDKVIYTGYKKYLSRFYDGYDDSGKNIGVFDPCSGLNSILSSGSTNIYQNQESYARNWWGISIIIQSLVLMFGLAATKLLFFNLLVLTIIVFSFKLNKYTKDLKIVFLLLMPFLLFTDIQDAYQSTPYVLSYIQIFFSGIVVMHYLYKLNFNLRLFFGASVILGSIYNFVFWLNFHLVLTFVSLLIFTLYFRYLPFFQIYRRIFAFLIGYIFGFIFTTIFKWVISILLFGKEITTTIKYALNLRLSPGSNGLSESLLNYSASFENFPLPLKSILINLVMFGSKFIDPRYATIVGIVVITILLITMFSAYIYFYNPKHYLTKLESLMILPILLIPLSYFAITSNHSFNHAGVTYRALAFVLSGFLIILYLGKARPDSKNITLG